MGQTGGEDLVILVADKDAHFTLKGIFANYPRLGIRRIEASFVMGVYHDSYVLRRCHDLLRPQQKRARYALVVLDREGCGRASARTDLETEIEARLARNGWEGRSAAVAIDPELEAWVWSDSPHVDAILGWPQGERSLRQWLVESGFLKPGQQKPQRPKEAFKGALRASGNRHSSALLLELAERVSFDRCTDVAFLKLKSTLQGWFPVAEKKP